MKVKANKNRNEIEVNCYQKQQQKNYSQQTIEHSLLLTIYFLDPDISPDPPIAKLTWVQVELSYPIGTCFSTI